MNALMAVVSELYSAGYFDERNLDNIASKLEMSDHGDVADRVRELPSSTMLWSLLSGGGNEDRVKP